MFRHVDDGWSVLLDHGVPDLALAGSGCWSQANWLSAEGQGQGTFLPGWRHQLVAGGCSGPVDLAAGEPYWQARAARPLETRDDYPGPSGPGV